MKQNSPLADYFIEKGFYHTETNGCINFPFYSDELKEIEAIKSGVGIHDISGYPLMKLTGTDTLDFLHRISTNDLKSLAPYQCTRTIFTSEKGRMLDEVVVFTTDTGVFLIGHEDKNELLEFWLNRFIIADDVKVENLYGKYGAVEVIGSKADEVLQQFFGNGAGEAAKGKVYSFTLENMYFRIINLESVNGLKRFLVIAPLDFIKVFVDNSSAIGKIPEVTLIGDRAYEQYRIEAGMPLSKELCDEYNPHEALLLHEVCFTKGCYIGQEVIARLMTYNKVQKRRCSFVFKNKLAEGKLP